MAIQPIGDLGGFGRLADILMQRRQMEAQQAQQDFANSMALKQFEAANAEREAQRRLQERQMSWKNDELLRAEEDRQRQEALGRNVGNAMAFQGPLPGGGIMDRNFMLSNVAGAVSEVPGARLADLLDAQKVVEAQYPDATKLSASAFGSGAGEFMQDKDGNVFHVAPTFDRKTGTMTIQSTPVSGGLRPMLSGGETPAQRTARMIQEARGRKEAEQGVLASTAPQIAGATEGAKEAAKRAANPEETERAQLEVQQKREQRESDLRTAVGKGEELLSAIDRISGSDETVNALTGLRGRVPAVTPSGVDAEAVYAQLNGLLTLENLGIMKGVLSDSDIKIIQAASSGLRPGMSKGEFLGRLKAIRAKVSAALDRNRGKIGATAPTQSKPASTGWIIEEVNQ